ncbi:hypothetical protein PFMALIP_04183 [Plasmodium falciparum MaliPS096_E11]|nr:hypothetical protein PFMALIP_04183 [Plasmodium falciparum MaliPS096_E11]
MCIKTKYVNKDIITKGLGIYPLLAKPLLHRLIKENIIKEKFIKNKGYESNIYIPMQNTFNKKNNKDVLRCDTMSTTNSTNDEEDNEKKNKVSK